MLSENFTKHFGATLKKLRAARKISQYVLADRSGFSRKYIQFIETGRQEALISNVFRLAEALDMTASKFVEAIENEIKSASEENQIDDKSKS